MIVTKEMVDYFLMWPLPESVSADVCATIRGRSGRTGTNLLTADEARQMLEYVLSDDALDDADRFIGQARVDAVTKACVAALRPRDVVVPIVPTEEMITAGADAAFVEHNDNCGTWKEISRVCYRAMVDDRPGLVISPVTDAQITIEDEHGEEYVLKSFASELEQRVHQFDAAIRRIAHHVGAVCGGVDTGPNGGHTAEEIIRCIDKKIVECTKGLAPQPPPMSPAALKSFSRRLREWINRGS